MKVMYVYRDLHPSSTGLIDPHNEQLPVGLIAQLAEHCTGIAGVWVRIPSVRPEFCLPRYYISSPPPKKKRKTAKITRFKHP